MTKEVDQTNPSSSRDNETLSPNGEAETAQTRAPMEETLTLKSLGVMEIDSLQVAETVEKLVTEADAALETCQTLFGKVEGTTKLRKRISSELKFLHGLSKEATCDLSQIHRSNMRHLLGILHVAKTYPDVTHLLKNISSKKRSVIQMVKKAHNEKTDGQDEGEVEEDFSVTVDIICNKGSSWVKVIARNAQALHLIWAGRGNYGTNTLFFQAEDYLQLAKENPINYSAPNVTFVFFSGVTAAMADALQEMGVTVVGRREEVSEETKSRLEALSDDEDESGSEDDDDGQGSHVDKRIRSESSSSSPSETLGDESIEGEYVLDNQPPFQPNIDNDLDLDLDVKLASALSRSASSDTLSTATSSTFPSNYMSINTDLDPYSVPRKVGQKRSENPRVFLDISTMIAMTSALCNGHADYTFEDKILTEQAERERSSPFLPTVEPVLEGKELFTCQMAADDFRKILGIMGGPEEKARGERLLGSLTIVPDAPSERAKALKESASIKTRAKVIFGTADTLKALICSANSGFVRAAGGQGVNFAVHIHQSRALTEGKQLAANKLHL